ncbi:T-cell immunomodulatory protein [Phlebotomus argentipes]|uniref:T-cell immunomodulatory protein n=1 Tax=Phlebotomus argentipes TaxID=94469 RepID=UPI002892A8C9|nr:T-cell immunomodulatory protein [Phlebotomus argentipes]
MKEYLRLLPLALLLHLGSCLDFTQTVFGSATDGVPAAFGDFNSDELTDMFMLRDDFRTVQIFLGSDTEPLLKEGPKCTFKNLKISSVVPGDFDGDAFMDVLITVKGSDGNLGVFVNWGGSSYMNCTDEEEKLLDIHGEPMVLDFNDDMVMDLFGLESTTDKRTFWLFKKDRSTPEMRQMPMHHKAGLRLPHSHAFIDLNHDFTADLFITAERNFEVWNGTDRHDGFMYSHTIDLPTGLNEHVGQALFLDAELKGNINLVLPICFDRKCSNSTILVHNGHQFHDLEVNFKDPDNKQWGFVVPDDQLFTNAITLRGGDFNMDGYPDLLATLQQHPGDAIQTFLLENVPSERKNSPISRTFVVRWKALAPFANGTVAGAFYDFYQDGILDVVLVEKSGSQYRTKAFRNSLDYDANFVKVIVLTGLVNKEVPTTKTPLGRTKKTYGTNLPGPRIAYYTITQDGYPQEGTSAQIPQSAYFALHLPYTIFGLGRTPNFVDSITVGLSNQSKTWTQLIPNSQVIVVPWPIKEPWRWKAQLFVTPSKLILMSMVALGGTCLVIMLIILGLYIKEKREDKLEKLQEAHRFHFDAM